MRVLKVGVLGLGMLEGGLYSPVGDGEGGGVKVEVGGGVKLGVGVGV